MKSPLAILLAAIACVFVACSNPERSGFHAIPAEGWVYDDTVTFALPDTTVAVGDIAVAVRFSNAYEYSNLWVETTYAGCDTLHTDTFNIVLADDFGAWYGTGVGVAFQKVDTLLRDVAVDPARPIGVRHIMRVDTLPDIEQIGIIFVPA